MPEYELPAEQTDNEFLDLHELQEFNLVREYVDWKRIKSNSKRKWIS